MRVCLEAKKSLLLFSNPIIPSKAGHSSPHRLCTDHLNLNIHNKVSCGASMDHLRHGGAFIHLRERKRGCEGYILYKGMHCSVVDSVLFTTLNFKTEQLSCC